MDPPGDTTELPREPTRELAPGDELGVYRLEALAGEGGMGRVFRARHQKLGRTVAIKVLRRKYSERADAIAQFFQEARAVNEIHHANLIQITDIVEAPAGGDHYYVMEWLDGESLQERLERQGALSLADAVGIARQVAGALGAAHRAGFIHRDVSPGNVYLLRRDGATVAKLLDFGVALRARASASGAAPAAATALATALVGAPGYFSPECAAGRGVDARSDVYALGVVIFEMVSGNPPFRAASVSEYAMKHMTEPPPPLARPTSAPGDVPPELAALVARCLAKAPEERFPSMAALAEALARIPVERHGRKRWHAVAASAGPLLLAGAIGIAFGSRRHTPSLSALPPVTAVLPGSMADLPAPLPEIAPAPPADPAPPEPPAALAEPASAATDPVDPRVTVTLESVPPGAEVYRGEVLLGTTPCPLRLPPGMNTLELRRRGFRPTPGYVNARPGTTVSVRLDPAAGRGAPRTQGSRNATIDPFGPSGDSNR